MGAKRILQPLFAVYVSLTFSASLLLMFPFFLAISTGRSAISRRMIYIVIRGWSRIWLALIGMPIRRSGEQIKPGRYVIVCNHISYLDTINIFPALPAFFRPLGKIEVSRIPILGFVYRQIVILVDRSSNESRTRSMRQMWRVLKREADIIIFPEGTFNETGKLTKSFYDGAFRLAITAQTPILPIVFPDTPHRWHYSGWWKLWPGPNRAIYLPAIDVTGMSITDVPVLKEKVRIAMETELAKYRYP